MCYFDQLSTTNNSSDNPEKNSFKTQNLKIIGKVRSLILILIYILEQKKKCDRMNIKRISSLKHYI